MIAITSAQLVGAVRQSLADHVVPAVTDDFAAVQLAAALVALEEVVERLSSGDPVDDENHRFAQVLTRLAEEVGQPASERLHQLTSARGPDSRSWNHEMRARLWEIAQSAEPQDRERLIAAVAELESGTAAADARWICSEAIASLM